MTEPTRTVADDSPAGDLFDGRYRLGRLLGRGGYARVYEAVDTALERTLAIKVIDGDGARIRGGRYRSRAHPRHQGHRRGRCRSL